MAQIAVDAVLDTPTVDDLFSAASAESTAADRAEHGGAAHTRRLSLALSSPSSAAPRASEETRTAMRSRPRLIVSKDTGRRVGTRVTGSTTKAAPESLDARLAQLYETAAKVSATMSKTGHHKSTVPIVARRFAAKDPEDLAAENTQLKMRVNELTQQRRELLGRARTLEEENTRTERRLEQVLTLNATRVGSASAGAASPTPGATLATALKQRLREKDAELKQLAREKDEMRQSVKFTRLSEMELELQTLGQENMRLQRELEHTRAQNARLQPRGDLQEGEDPLVSELAAARAEAANVRRQLGDAQREAAEARGEAAATLRSRQASATARQNTANAQQTQLAAAQAQTAAVEKRLRFVQAELIAVRDDNAALVRAQQDAAAQTERERERSRTLQRQLETARATTAQADEGQLARLRSELQTARDALTDLRNQHNAERTRAHEHACELEARHAQVLAQLRDSQGRVRALEDAASAAGPDVAKLHDELSGYRQSSRELQTKLDESATAHERAQELAAQLQKTLGQSLPDAFRRVTAAHQATAALADSLLAAASHTVAAKKSDRSAAVAELAVAVDAFNRDAPVHARQWSAARDAANATTEYARVVAGKMRHSGGTLAGDSDAQEALAAAEAANAEAQEAARPGPTSPAALAAATDFGGSADAPAPAAVGSNRRSASSLLNKLFSRSTSHPTVAPAAPAPIAAASSTTAEPPSAIIRRNHARDETTVSSLSQISQISDVDDVTERD